MLKFKEIILVLIFVFSFLFLVGCQEEVVEPTLLQEQK
jgi:hypothetical protein